MRIKTQQVLIYGGKTKNGQWLLVEPKVFKKVYVFPPRIQPGKTYEGLIENREYKFDLTVILDIESVKASVNGNVDYLNKVKLYIDGVEEVSE